MTSEQTGPIRAWLDAFQRAWETDDPVFIGSLWAENAVYYPSPFALPWRGRKDIVTEWLKLGEAGIPWEFDYEIECDTPENAVVTTHITYPPDSSRGFSASTEYRGVWIVRFDKDGRAREYIEYWMQRT